METGGARAIKSGDSQLKKIEHFLQDTLSNGKGVRFGWRETTETPNDPTCCKSIYGLDTWGHIFLTHVPGFESGLILESHFQASRGSGDEKFPYHIANIKQCYPYPTIMIMELKAKCGSPPSLQLRFDAITRYCESQVDGRKLIAVMSPSQFEIWFRNRVNYYGLP